MICERILRDRENELREEYERILHAKLADQYEQFVKFTYDQLHRSRPSTGAPSCKLNLILHFSTLSRTTFLVQLLTNVFFLQIYRNYKKRRTSANRNTTSVHFSNR
jgi:hypothetical protein